VKECPPPLKTYRPPIPLEGKGFYFKSLAFSMAFIPYREFLARSAPNLKISENAPFEGNKEPRHLAGHTETLQKGSYHLIKEKNNPL